MQSHEVAHFQERANEVSAFFNSSTFANIINSASKGRLGTGSSDPCCTDQNTNGIFAHSVLDLLFVEYPLVFCVWLVDSR